MGATKDLRTETCKAALCAEITARLGFDPSNAPFSPTLSPEAQAEFDRLCAGVCQSCPILETAVAMKAAKE